MSLPYAASSDPAVLASLASGGSPKELKSLLQLFAALAIAHAKRESARNPMSALAETMARSGLRSIAQSALPRVGERGEVYSSLGQKLRQPADTMRSHRSYGRMLGDTRGFHEWAALSKHDASIQEFARQAAPAILIAHGQNLETEAAVKGVAALPKKERALVLAECIDLASHRLDAWITALATARLHELRSGKAKGLRVGAFGWVEGVRPDSTAATYGHIHAPGLAQATTAAILRSGYDAHSHDPAGKAYAIDLSSARVRAGLDLIDARRAGQPLREVLGYWIERRVIERGLGRLIRNLRRLRDEKLPSETGAVVAEPAPEHAAAAVCDGLALIHFDAKELEVAVSQDPEDNPFIGSEGWAKPNAKELTMLKEIIAEAKNYIDSAADLLLAESVHQLALGNMARAAAAADLGADGGVIPQLDFVASPIETRTLAHRVILLLGSAPGWPNNPHVNATPSPRAVAAPELEAWAAARLGPPDRIAVARTSGGWITLAQAGLAALDFVFGVAQPDAFEAVLRRLLGLNTPIARRGQPAFLHTRPADLPAAMIPYGAAAAAAGAMAAVLARLGPASRSDLVAPGSSGAREPGLFDLAVSRDRLYAARDILVQQRVVLANASDDAAADAAIGMLTKFGIVASGPGRRAVALAEADLRIERFLSVLKSIATVIRQEHLKMLSEALFGPNLPIAVPLSTPVGGDPISKGLVAPATALPSRLRRWLADLGAVRPALAALSDSLLASDALGGTTQLSSFAVAADNALAKVTDFPGDSDPGAQSAALFFVETLPNATVGRPEAAYLLDAYIETISLQGQRTSAVAFSAPAPTARPPQAFLLAVSPGSQPFNTDRVAAVVAEALALAKLRGVTLDQIAAGGALLPAILVPSESVGGEPAFDLTPGSDDKADKSMSYRRN